MRNEIRKPDVRATLNGVTLSGIISVEIESNNHFASDRFRLSFAASLVQHTLLHIPGGQVDIEVALDQRWSSCLVGLIDNVRFNSTLGTIDVEGRDLSSSLIDTQIDETFSNQTASEIAVLIGLRHGLLVAADPTSTPVGRYYQSEHDRVTLGQFAKTMTEWDLLAYLAIREGFDLFVSGRVLRFGFPILTGARLLRPRDCISLRFDHVVGLGRPIDVLVRSWNSKSGEVATGEAFLPGLGSVWQRRITRPNLSSASAQQQAQRAASDLKRHEWTASLTMPGELELSARSVVLIEDALSPWDRLYRIVQLSRRIDVKRGFTQSLSLQGIA